MSAPTYTRHRFPPEIIGCPVWLYDWVALSSRDIEELLTSRDLDVSDEAVHLWCGKFGPAS